MNKICFNQNQHHSNNPCRLSSFSSVHSYQSSVLIWACMLRGGACRKHDCKHSPSVVMVEAWPSDCLSVWRCRLIRSVRAFGGAFRCSYLCWWWRQRARPQRWFPYRRCRWVLSGWMTYCVGGRESCGAWKYKRGLQILVLHFYIYSNTHIQETALRFSLNKRLLITLIVIWNQNIWKQIQTINSLCHKKFIIQVHQ